MGMSRPDKAGQCLTNGNASFTPIEDEIQPFSRCARHLLRLFGLSSRTRVFHFCIASASKHDNVEQTFRIFRRRAPLRRLLKRSSPPLDVAQMLEYRGLVANNARYPVAPGFHYAPNGGKGCPRFIKRSTDSIKASIGQVFIPQADIPQFLTCNLSPPKQWTNPAPRLRLRETPPPL